MSIDETRHLGGLKFGFAGWRRPQTKLRSDKRLIWAHGLRLTCVVFQPDVFETLRLARTWENSFTPINRIPPEILSIIPDFLDTRSGVIPLTHVCRAWREIFVSRPSLWTDFDCTDAEKTRVYLERSKSSPIDLWLDRKGPLSPYDPLHQIIPHAAGRLKSLHIDATSKCLDFIGAHLSRPAPLLKKLSICGDHDPVLPPTLFNGNLSSLRKLHLEDIRTELPWRNMVNLTSFILVHTSSISVKHLLDFFESAPRLRQVNLHSTSRTLVSGDRSGRLVPLRCLKKMYAGDCRTSPLFDHLLIPVGTSLTMGVEGFPPRFIDNLKNLSNFTSITLGYGRMRFSGPNGEVEMIPHVYMSYSALESLTHFDTSGTKQLEIKSSPFSTSDSSYRALLHMNDLRTLILTRCGAPHTFIHALHPNPSGVILCPRLEEIVIEYWEMFDIGIVIGTAAARASEGAKLKAVRLVCCLRDMYAQLDTSELKKHVLHVESRCT